MIGEMVGSYRIVRPLGEGGMGMVFVAQHPLLGREAIVKMLRPEFCRHKETIERFFNEARASTLIKHPGIVDIFDFGYHASGRAFIVMEFLPGESVASRLRMRGVLSEPEAFAIVRGIAGALAAAHAAGIVHRDLKPENIFLVPDPEVPGGERVKLLDFGIAKLTVEASGASASTRTGALLGTPLYMAPEQCRGAGDIDHRCDLYSVGCILFEMLSGRLPFESDGSGEIIGAHQFVPAPALRSRAPGCSPAAEHLVASLLAKSRGDRIQTAHELLRLTTLPALPAIERGAGPPGAFAAISAAPALTTLGGMAGTKQRTLARRHGWFVGGAAIVVVAAAVAVIGVTSNRAAPSPPIAPSPVAAAPVPEPAPVPPPPPAPAPAAPPAPAPDPTVPFDVTTVPVGAEIVVDGASLGPSPIATTIDRSEASARVAISHRGYETRIVTVRRSAPIHLEIQLAPRARARRPEAPLDKNRTVDPFAD